MKIVLPNVLPEWQQGAVCAQVDPELFYPPKGGDATPAKRICRGCDVRLKCLKEALDNNEEFGVWGGLSERERRALKKRQVRGASAEPSRLRQRSGLADHHQKIAAMLDRPTPATWAQIGAAIGYSEGAVKKYWHRQQATAQQQQEQELAA